VTAIAAALPSQKKNQVHSSGITEAENFLGQRRKESL